MTKRKKNNKPACLPANLALEAVRAMLARHVPGAVDPGERPQAEVAKVGDAPRRRAEVAVLSSLEQYQSFNQGSSEVHTSLLVFLQQPIPLTTKPRDM